MDSNPDETVLDLRTEVYELLDDLKELKFSCVDDFDLTMSGLLFSIC
jgi:hypothetical protein